MKEFMKKNKALIFIAVTLTILLVMILLLKGKSVTRVSIDLSLGKIPAEYDSALIYTSTFIFPIDDDEEYVLEYFGDNKIPLTVFVSVPEGQDILEQGIYDLLELADEYEADIEIASAGHEFTDYTSLSYDNQERFLRQHRKSLENLTGMDIEGFRPPGYRATLDTLLAAENANFDYITPYMEDSEPFHPDSMVGGKMNIIIFPITNADLEVKTIDIIPSQFESTPDHEDAWLAKMSDVNEEMRRIEKTTLRMTTDFNDLTSFLDITDPTNATKIRIRTNLVPDKIFYGNESLNWTRQGNLTSFVVNESVRQVSIEWEEL